MNHTPTMTPSQEVDESYYDVPFGDEPAERSENFTEHDAQPVEEGPPEDDRGETDGIWTEAPKQPAPLLTELGNAKRLIYRHGRDLRHCHPWKRFLWWDATEGHWQADVTGHAAELAKGTILELFDEASRELEQLKKLCENEDDADSKVKQRLAKVKTILAWAVKSQTSRQIDAMLKLARSEPGMPILPDTMDGNPWLFNCKNGTLDLQTGKLRPHRREDNLTSSCPVHYDPAAPHTLWLTFLDQVFQGKRDLIQFVQRLFGYCLSGSVSEQILPIFWGVGANGKSTLINVFMNVMGSGYAEKASRDLLMAVKGDRHPTHLAQLHGKRLVAAIESGENAKLDEPLVKELTGGDPITARRMREDFWQFQPSHKLVLITNHKPVVQGTDHAIWRRLRLVPFNAVFDGDRQDKKLPDRLMEEASGILAWAVQGCLDWQREGLTTPEDVLVATKEYRGSQDLLSLWIEERCVTGMPDYQAPLAWLFTDFENWTKKSGERAMTRRKFADALREKSFEDFLSNGLKFKGIALRATNQDEDETEPRNEI